MMPGANMSRYGWRHARAPASGSSFRASLVPESLSFQDPIDEICERPASFALRGTLGIAVAFFVVLLLTAAIARVDIVVVANGRLSTATPPIVLQPMDRAIIRELRVQPGDAVKKGEIVATLDPTFVTADTAELQQRHRALQAQLQRLQAEADGQAFEMGATPDRDGALQASIYHQRQSEYAAHVQAYDEDIARLRATQETVDDGMGSLGREVDVAKEVEAIRSTLLKAQSGSRLSLLDAQSSRLRTEHDQQEAADRLKELRYSQRAREAERQAFIDGWQRELTESLVGTRSEIASVQAALAKATRLHDLVVVTAPADGIVLDIAPLTAGSVLREAEPLLTIVPNDAPLIAEIMIASSDVGYTGGGADVTLKINAFPYQQHGVVAGRLESVGEESFASTSGGETPVGAFHRGRVKLITTKLSHLPAGARLFPGMTLTAEIAAGSRSVLSYFLYPLTRGLAESMREP